MNTIPAGYFKQNYGPLRGRAWIRDLPEDERRALAHIAFERSGYGRAGGKARAIKATRDSRGRFLPKTLIKA